MFMRIFLWDDVRSSYSQLVLLSEGRQMETATCCFDKEHSKWQKKMGILLRRYFGHLQARGKIIITNLLNRYLLNLSVANHIDWNYLVEGVRMWGVKGWVDIEIATENPECCMNHTPCPEQLQTWPTYLPSSLRIKHFAQLSLLTLNPQTIPPLFLHVTLNLVTGHGLMSN